MDGKAAFDLAKPCVIADKLEETEMHRCFIVALLEEKKDVNGWRVSSEARGAWKHRPTL